MRLNIFDHPELLWRPEHVSDMPWWHGHIPFAFYLTGIHRPRTFVELGTHKGDSYMAFCQAVSAFGLETQCYAVDNWTGDAHVGEMPESVYSELKSKHDTRYGRFSTLVRMDFDRALNLFPTGSIDLLHIDGTHTYEAVSRDVEAWLPRLSDRGILLMHDTAARLADFGVHIVWEELAQAHPRHLAFHHSAGLGVVGIGTNLGEEVAALLSASDEEKRIIAEFFARLGTGLAVEIDTPENISRVRGVSKPRNVSDRRPAEVTRGEPRWRRLENR